MYLPAVQKLDLLVTLASSADADSPWEGGIFCLRCCPPHAHIQNLHVF